MAARPLDWPCADEGTVLEKLRQELLVTGRAAKVAQLLAEDCSSTAEEQQCALCVRLEMHCFLPEFVLLTDRFQHVYVIRP